MKEHIQFERCRSGYQKCSGFQHMIARVLIVTPVCPAVHVLRLSFPLIKNQSMLVDPSQPFLASMICVQSCTRSDGIPCMVQETSEAGWCSVWFNSAIAMALWLAISNRCGRITWPRESIVPIKTLHIFNFRAALAYYSSDMTLRTCREVSSRKRQFSKYILV